MLDVLSNGLAAVIILTILSAAVSGSGVERWRPELMGDPGRNAARLRAEEIPPRQLEKKKLEHLLVQVSFTVSPGGEVPPVEVEPDSEEYLQYASPTNRAEQVLIVPLDSASTWAFRLPASGAIRSALLSVTTDGVGLADFWPCTVSNTSTTTTLVTIAPNDTGDGYRAVGGACMPGDS